MAEIIDIKEAWEGHSGAEVETFVKQEFGGKYGHIRLVFDSVTSFYNIEAFASKEDALTYDEDPVAYETLRLLNEAIPISTIEGDAYTARLATSISNTANIVVTNDKLNIPLNYRSIKITQIGNENAGYSGTLVIHRSTDNGATWSDVGSIPNILTSQDIDATNVYQDVNIGPYLAMGAQLIRLRATFSYENESGDTKVVTSSNVIVGATVTKTSLRLDLVTNYEQPLSAVDVNGNAQPLSITYAVYGSVQKTAYLRITGSTGVVSESTFDLSASVDSQNKTFSFNEDAAYGLTTHGVKKVEAWLECSDGMGKTLKSEVLVNRFMMVNKDTPNANLTKPYLLLQNVDSEVGNFVQTEIAEYAVYNPSGENVNVAFLLTTYTDNYEQTKPTEYFRFETIVEPNKQYNLLTTIEIENEDEGSEVEQYDTYFRVRRITDTTNTDFMNESTGEKTYYISVDNRNAMTPVSGATFLLNPKVRNNNEENPKRILNAKNNNAEVESVWANFGFINDGWMTADDGQKVLRVMAGSTLEIKKNIWAQFLTNPNSSVTFEMDFKVDNITDLENPIVKMFEGTTASFKGLCMNTMEGWIMNTSNTDKDACLFSWQEGVRTHLVINIHHQVKPNKGDVNYTTDNASKANGTLALARIIINGDCVREIPFSVTNKNEWCSSANGSIIIGNEGADIDIYSIRIYEGKVVEMTDILNRNYVASIPNADKKNQVREKNDLLDGGRISLEKTKLKGLNCYVWHGKLPYHGESSEQKGWVEIFRYDSDGKYLPEYSGTLCKETKSLEGKGQGSTAKTYYDWNLQEDGSKVKATIQVDINKIHSEIHIGEPYTAEDGKQYVNIYGGHLGKNAPIEIAENAQPYEYINGKVVVPDGWIDGNGMYRGTGYRVAEGTSLAQKRVIKINYASSMQSHLIGACNTYDLLHRKVVGDTPLQQVIPDAVSAKRTEPFMFFNQEEGKNVYFKGMGTYGAGKADKVTWGYVKKLMPQYALIEGSDNNLPMTGFRVPFDINTAVYSTKDEGWKYNGQQSWDFDLGATTESSDLGYTTDGTTTDDGEVELPTDLITEKWADVHNFIYLHSSNIKYFNGTFAQFSQSDKASDTNYKYWCTQDSNFYLYRYDYINGGWVHAGLWNGSAYKSISLKTDLTTQKAFTDWSTGGTGDYAALNEAFINAYVAQMKKFIKFFINEKSLQFNYCYVLGFLAGTDNSDKNTYYKIMPYAETIAEDASFSSWFLGAFGKSFDYSKIHRIYLDGDDMDSIFRTNNNSHQTKPYYIDRLHPYADGSTECLYEGMGNQLFNFVEKAYESTGELATMMNNIMIAATELVSETDKLYGLESGKVSLWGFLHKYFFNIQYYFPQIAYMEQARIRYEFPELLGFISSGGGARSIRPITQSLGSQLQNELQYMNHRVIYITSYAVFGAWGGDTTHSIGLPDANETFSFVPASMPNGSASTYTFTITPHQYIYPSHYYGGTFTSTRQRTSPKQTCTFTIAKDVLGSDTGMGICGINYISDLGDLSYQRITGTIIIKGKRLLRLYAYGRYVLSASIFEPVGVKIETQSLKSITLFGVMTMRGLLDMSMCIRCTSIDCRYAYSNDYVIPQSSALSSLSIGNPNNIKNLDISNLPNLSTLVIREAKTIENLNIGANVGTNTSFNSQPVVESIYSSRGQTSTPVLKSIHIENVDWTDFDVNALSWFADIPTCEFKGKIAIKENGAYGLPKVTWNLKNKINAKWGNVDEGANDLKLTYLQREFTGDATINGSFYVEAGNVFPFEVVPNSQYMNTQTAIKYSVEGGGGYTIDENTGVLTVNSLSNTEHHATIKANVSTNYSGTKANYSLSKQIEIWNRPAQLGDLVYADGTFSSVDTYEGEKTPIGVCFWVAPRDDNGNVVSEYANPNDKQLRLMVSMEDVKIPVGTSEESSLQWGVYKSTVANEGLFDKDASGNAVYLTSDKVSDVYNILSITNLTSSGLSNSYIDPAQNSDYRSTSDEALRYNYGFKLIAADKSVGDGFGYGETPDFVAARTLDDDLAKLAGSAYKSGDIVNSAYAKTLKVIQHRNALLNSNIIGADKEVLIPSGRFPVPYKTTDKSELGNLGLLMSSLRAWGKDEFGETDDNSKKWSQLAYPFASACYAYEPTMTLKDGENLAEKFKAHNWFAPTHGLLARICWYVKYGASQGVGVINEAVSKNLLNFSTSSNHWSVAESYMNYAWYVYIGNGFTDNGNKLYSYVGRAVSAF